MDYEPLISKLKAANILPSKVLNVAKDGEYRTIGLHCDCSPLLRHDEEKKIRDICGNEFFVSWIGNGSNYYFITAKPNP